MSESNTINLTGMKCPMPIVHLNRAVRNADQGQELSVSADDPAFELDVTAWCRRTGHDLCSIDSSDGTLTAIIKVSDGQSQAAK